MTRSNIRRLLNHQLETKSRIIRVIPAIISTIIIIMPEVCFTNKGKTSTNVPSKIRIAI